MFRTHQQKQGAASRLHRSASGQSVTPPARCQGEPHSLTVLGSMTFARQRNGSGGSRNAVRVCVSLTHFSTFIHGYF